MLHAARDDGHVTRACKVYIFMKDMWDGSRAHG